jgi:hypothetical protein
MARCRGQLDTPDQRIGVVPKIEALSHRRFAGIAAFDRVLLVSRTRR